MRLGGRWPQLPLEVLTDALPAAVAVIPDHGEPNLDAIDRLLQVGRPAMARDLLTVPTSGPAASPPAQAYPQLLPTWHDVPVLSDQLYPIGLRQGRALTAAVVHMRDAGATASHAITALNQLGRVSQ